MLRGFNRLDSDTMGTVSVVDGTRTFSHAVKAGEAEFYFWSGGTQFVKTTTQTVVFPDTTGTYYFYYDTSGVLQYVENSAITEAVFLTVAICGMLYWNAVTNESWLASDELHGIIMDPSSHFNLHLTRGFLWAVGGVPTGFADASDVYTSISASLHFDEDIPISTDAVTSTPFMYRTGSDGEWVMTATDDLKIGHIASGDTYISWNEYTGGAWQLTESASSTDYIIYMMVKTNFADKPYRKIVGQQTYASRALARDGLMYALNAIKLNGLSSPEVEFQYAWIAKRNGDLEDDGNGNAYVDLRGVPVHAFS